MQIGPNLQRFFDECYVFMHGQRPKKPRKAIDRWNKKYRESITRFYNGTVQKSESTS